MSLAIKQKKIEFTLLDHQAEFVNNQSRYLLNSGGVGCISGDTCIRLNRAGKGFKMPIEKAYESFHGINKNKRNFEKDIVTYIRSKINETVQLNEVEDIKYSGINPVYELILENGHKLKATFEHEILTYSGFKKLGTLTKDDFISCDNLKQGIITYSKGKSLRYIGKEKTYDVCCKENHNFTANDIIIHNSGKTYSIVLKTLALIVSFPGIFILIGAQTYPLLRDTTLREFLNIVPSEMIKFYNKSTLHFIFFNGSEVIFRAFNDETKLKSLNLGACGIEEMTDVSEEIFKMVRTRMRQPKMPGCVYGATNPNTFGNWVYKYFIENPIVGSTVVFSKSIDNDYLPKEYLDDLESMKVTNPEYYNRMVAGIWGQMEGLVYNLPDALRIKTDGIEYQRYIAGLDFGYTHPTAFVVIGIIEDNYYVIDEIYRHKMTSADIIDAVKDKAEAYNFDAIYCDTARPEIIEDMKRAGLPARESIKDVFDGIMWVKSLIGKEKIFVSTDCVYTLREFDSYIWDSGSEIKEIPIKINDDCMDAMRYALYSDRAKTQTIIRWV